MNNATNPKSAAVNSVLFFIFVEYYFKFRK